MTLRQGLAAVLYGSCGVLLAGIAQAEVCPAGEQGKSCHSTGPTEEQSGDGVALTVLPGVPVVAWQSGGVEIEPGEPSELESQPGLRTTLSGGLWGNSGAEPIAVAIASFEYYPDASVDFLAQPDPEDYYAFACELGEPLCMAYGAGLQYRRIRQSAGAFMQRRYRITQVNPAALPAAVTAVPLLVDYAISFFAQGEQELAVGTRSAIFNTGSVELGHFESIQNTIQFRGVGVECGSQQAGPTCFETLANGSTTAGSMSGTLARDVPLTRLDAVALRIEAVTSHSEAPECRDQPSNPGDDCLIMPWSGSGHTVVDPYVYIDPAWQYASWFELEISADETDTTWVTPQRTPIDAETLTLLDGAGGAGGETSSGGAPIDEPGSAGARASAGEAASNGGEGTVPSGGGVPGRDDPEPSAGRDSAEGGAAAGNGKSDASDDCGCRVVAPARPGSALVLVLAGVAALLSRRRSRSA